MSTFNTLHRDVKLTHKGYGKYDRELLNGDFVIVKDAQSLAQAITIKIMTIWNELNTNPTYKEWGNMAWALIKDNYTRMTQFKLEEYTRTAINEMRRVKQILSLTVSRTDNPEKFNISFSVLSINDDLINGGVELGI